MKKKNICDYDDRNNEGNFVDNLCYCDLCCEVWDDCCDDVYDVCERCK